MERKTSPLEALVVKNEVLAEEELAKALLPFLRFTEDGQLLPSKRFENLSTLDKTCCVLLAGSALHALGKRDRPGFQNAEIMRLTGMPEGTVGPKLSQLKKERIAVKKGKDWVIAGYALRSAVERLADADFALNAKGQ
jgi:hypothetical protein